MEKKINSYLALNLGCGKTKIPNTIGVDATQISGCVDLIHDLEKLPYPFKNNSVDEIHFYHVLEHLENPLKKLEEIHRILKSGGKLYIRVPHFSSMGAFTDITHVRPFGFCTFDIFEKSHPQHYYTKIKFKIIKKEIKYFGLYPNDGIYEKYIHENQCPIFFRPIVRIINYLIRLSPTTFERFWCYWVGGACEISLTLTKK